MEKLKGVKKKEVFGGVGGGSNMMFVSLVSHFEQCLILPSPHMGLFWFCLDAKERENNACDEF